MPAPVSNPEFPALPLPHQGLWSGHVQAAFQSMQESYLRARQLLDLDEIDPLRLRYHLDRIQNETVAILLSLDGQGPPQDWLEVAAVELGTLTGDLQAAVEGTEQRCALNTHLSVDKDVFMHLVFTVTTPTFLFRNQ